MALSTQDSSPRSSYRGSLVLGKHERACAIINCALENALLRVLRNVGDDFDRMLSLLDPPYASNWTVSLLVAQTQLF